MQQMAMTQDGLVQPAIEPFKLQLLKWIGNKQRFSHEIASLFPADYGTYIEPFLGSGGVLGTVSPERAIASDVFKPLMQIWGALSADPEMLKSWYRERHQQMMSGEKVEEYERIKASYNARPNGADLLFLCRSCYGGVVRFRKSDGFMSTPCGPHKPISPESFDNRVQVWSERTKNTEFVLADFEEILDRAESGDMVYCDPPYTHSQAILYGAQDFELVRLLSAIERCKDRGVFVALSIDGKKKSGDVLTELPIPDGLFEHNGFVNVGRSMLRRFQMEGESLEGELVADRLLLTY